MQITKIETWAESANHHAISLAYGSGFVFEKNLRPVLFIGGVHGDEPEGVELSTRLLEYLEHSNEKFCPWLLIPCLNPDGYMAGKRTNANGVDLNRNYAAKNWSPEYEKDRYFPGDSPASEPEIQALQKLIEQEKPRLIVHFHSWEPCIVYSGAAGLKDAQHLAKASGYKLLDSIGYTTTGALSSYAAIDLNIPVICIEEQQGVSLQSVWPRFKEGLLQILNDVTMREK